MFATPNSTIALTFEKNSEPQVATMYNLLPRNRFGWPR